ncbi:hypothetical protein [Salinithrix halophila]|uniref:Uncharacterized protein n=1 Tax=Salinithrix halophila TaxID=1485204 RepID=A0ABV8JCX9_9BACL
MTGWFPFNDQRGIALPFVLAVSVLLFILLTAALSQLFRSGHTVSAEWKTLRAQYAAESGLARIQNHLCTSRKNITPITTRINGIQAKTQVEGRARNAIRLVSVARGRGIKQTIRVEVDRETCQIREWSR